MSETSNQLEILLEAFEEVIIAAAARGLSLCSSDEEKEKFLTSCEKDADKFLAEGFRLLSKKS